MKYVIPLVAIMAVAVVGTIGITGFSAATMMTASTPMMTSSSNMMGHLEYTLVDANGQIKAYGQTDNLVTNLGDRCAAELIFENDSGDAGGGDCTGNVFNVIGISNKTGTVSDTTDFSVFEQAGTLQAGVMATINVGAGGVTIDNISDGAGNIGAVITNSAHPFTFSDDTAITNMSAGGSSTTLTNAYLLDATCTVDGSGQGTCATIATAEILAGQSLGSLQVSDGDSLTITWTVTLGASGS